MNTSNTKADKSGELRLVVCGQERNLRLSYRALRGVERSLGVGIMQLLLRIRDKDFRMEDIAVVIRESIIGGGVALKDAPTEEDVGECIMANGLEDFISPYAQLIGGVAIAARRAGEQSTGEATTQTAL